IKEKKKNIKKCMRLNLHFLISNTSGLCPGVVYWVKNYSEYSSGKIRARLEILGVVTGLQLIKKAVQYIERLSSKVEIKVMRVLISS
ncbi:hypothetical protein, partial [Chryseobacterium elymi]|uniref:hypothetical protein n=1 Tax=Chryseobacterium elymi TaxID=395936 RepID=UPI001EE86785